MDELEIAKALEGKFFWERTTKYEGDTNKDVVAIRRTQKRFRPKESYTKRYAPTKADELIVPVLTNRECPVQRLNKLKTVVASAYGIDPEDVMTRSTAQNTSQPKIFYMWAIQRYFEDITLAEAGRIIDRHHSTLIHARKEFDNIKHMYADLIAKVDAVMMPD